jgi:ribosomal protein RSM22 (predicted rRNA methylase)
VAAPFDRALREAIDDAIAGGGAPLARAVEALSRRYRDDASADAPTGRLTDAERLAYAAVRLPATAAALDAAFAALAAHTRLVPTSITDLGAGPATVLWPALARWPNLRQVALVDRDPDLLSLGLRLSRAYVGHMSGIRRDEAGHMSGVSRDDVGHTPGIRPTSGDLATADAPAADLVVLSYAVGELAADRVAPAVDRAWTLTRGALVVVEPGTPAGFARIRAVRDRLRTAGAAIVAPCPHDDACPMSAGDWCHFAVRLDRSRAHRLLKQGALGWEDEKFSYVIAARDAAIVDGRAAARILRRPRKDTGHVRLALCRPGGLADVVVTRREPTYKAARDAAWGGAWPPHAPTVEPDRDRDA